jgi:hypothetical protein
MRICASRMVHDRMQLYSTSLLLQHRDCSAMSHGTAVFSQLHVIIVANMHLLTSFQLLTYF